MSKRYPGGVITKSPATPTGPYQTGAAPGIWTLDQQLQYQQQGVWPTAGLSPNYIEDVFSTYLYTGNGSTQTITNNIDLSGKGGLVWIKCRAPTAYNNWLSDTVRGNTKRISSNTTSAESTLSTSITSFNSNGFSIGSNSNVNDNGANETYVSWTFREQPKFFDVVTYTGDGTNPRNISHNLGSVPGCVIAKRTSTTGPWAVYHSGVSPINNNTLALQSTAAASDGGQDLWGNGATVVVPTSTVFTVSNSLNTNGVTYVAYLFAHDAGGFGLTGTDNVISCGSYVEGGVGTEQTINLGYEAQWLLIKPSSVSGSWYIYDVMRGFAQTVNNYLLTNSANAEASTNSYLFKPAATGFIAPGDLFGSSANVIYIAIRRGPMKVPTLGTSVFALDSSGGTLPNPPGFNAGFPVDLGFFKYTAGVYDWSLGDRLRGAQELYPNLTSAEVARADFKFDYQDGWLNSTGVASTIQSWNFRRAPGFFDEVCYTGTGAARSLSHNLGVAPELAIVKDRNVGSLWYVQNAAMFAAYTGVSPGGYYCVLNTTAALTDGGGNYVYNPTASTISLDNGVNFNTRTYVAYLFATCAGVSKVGSYTGNGTTQTINCGFTAGARFVLIKRTDSTGDWRVVDTARGMVSGTDPYLSLNSTAAEVNANNVYTVTTGFQLVSSDANFNANGGSYIFLAVA